MQYIENDCWNQTRSLVSVIIPAFNVEEYIAQCIESVLAQTYSNIEVIVVDDGSTDNTLNILMDFASLDDRLRIIKQENKFAGVARNTGLDASSGQFIYFLDADDWIEVDALELLVGAIERHNTDIAIARSEGFDNQTNEQWLLDYALNGVPFDVAIGVDFYASRLFQCFMGWPWDKLYRADFIKKIELRFQTLRTTNDAYFVFGSLALAEKVCCIDKVLFHHRTNNQRSLEGSRAKSWHCAIDAMESISELLMSLPLATELMLSYDNWVLNYSYWSIATLNDDIGDLYLDAISPILQAMPNDDEHYPNYTERSFRQLLCLNRSQLVLKARKLEEQNNDLAKENEELSKEIEALRNHIDVLNGEISHRDSTIEQLYTSHSYTLGHTLLTPLSAMKRMRAR